MGQADLPGARTVMPSSTAATSLGEFVDELLRWPDVQGTTRTL